DTVQFSAGAILRKNLSRIPDLELSGYRIGGRRLHYHIADVTNCEQLAARRSELALELKLVGDNPGEGRANSSVTQLSFQSGKPVLGLLELSFGDRAVIWADRSRVQSSGGFSQPQIVFGSGQCELGRFNVL